MPNVRIDVDAIIDRVRLREQAGNPAIPSSGFGWLFEKSDGDFYFMNDAGEVQGPLGRKYFTLTVSGDLTVESGALRFYNLTGKTLIIKEVHIAVDTAPTGAAIIVDIHKNGTTIFTTQANRPQIAAAAFTGNTTTIDVSSWANDDYLQADVDQIGSTIAGSDLTITVIAL